MKECRFVSQVPVLESTTPNYTMTHRYFNCNNDLTYSRLTVAEPSVNGQNLNVAGQNDNMARVSNLELSDLGFSIRPTGSELRYKQSQV